MADFTVTGDTKLDSSGLESGLSKIGSLAAAAFSVAAVVGFANAVKDVYAEVINLGTAFETSLAKASTLFGGVNVDTSGLTADILAISNASGQAASSLNESLYQALSAGIPVTENMATATGFLTDASMLSVAGYTDMSTAVEATAKTLNAYNLDISETDRIQKVLIQTQNKGITTVNELGQYLSQVTPTAAAFGVSFEQVGASLAGMTAAGVPTAQATTQLKTLIAELGKEGTEAADALLLAAEGSEYAGMNFSQMMDNGADLSVVLGLMKSEADETGVSLVDMFGSIEAGQAALTIESSDFTGNLQAMSTEADVVGEAYTTMSETLEFQMDRAKTSFENVGIAAYEGLKEPLADAVGSALDSLDDLGQRVSSGDLQDDVQKLGEGFGDLIGAAVELGEAALPVVIEGLAFVAENGETVIKILGLIGAAMLTYKTYTSITVAVTAAWKSATAALIAHEAANRLTTVATYGLGTSMTLTQGVVGVLTGKISLATLAQGALNAVMNLNPVFLLITGFTALAGALVLYNDHANKTDPTRILTNALAEQREEINALAEARAAAQEAAVVEFDTMASYKTELDGLIDANGKVVEGYEARAGFLVGELAEATGIDIQLIDGQIQGYQELQAEIDKTIEKMRAEAILEAGKEEYINALEKQGEALATLNEAQDQYNEKFMTFDSYLASRDITTGPGSRLYEEARMQWENEYGIMEENLANAEADYATYTNTITAYEQQKTDIIQEEYGKVNAIVDGSKDVYATTNAEKKELLEQSIADEQTYIDTLKANRTEANAETTDALIKAAEDRIQAQKDELVGVDQAIKDGQADVVASSAALGNSMTNSWKNAIGDTTLLGIDYAQGIIDGANSKLGEIAGTAYNIGLSMLQNYNSSIGRASPAKRMIEAGIDFVKGGEVGLEERKRYLLADASQLGTDTVQAFADSADAVEIGKDFTATLSYGINDGTNEILNSMQNAADGVISIARDTIAQAQRDAATSVTNNNITTANVTQYFTGQVPTPYQAYKAAWANI